MEEPVRKLGPYKLISKIGRGAFGVVWLGEKQTSIATTRFALKLPRDEDIDIETFKKEAAIWVQASGHANVLPMIEADIYDDQVVIVSEYVPDGSLSAWLREHQGKAPSIEVAIEMIDGVLAGLAHLHERLIIHRDLKPDNILLQRNTPRLTDFGIARLLRSGSYSTNISGTLAYMAPEAFDGKRNEQTDVWSTGIIFYQLLAGRLPYDQPDMSSFIGALMRYDPPALPESVPEVVRRVLMKSLERDPSKRYTSAAEMRRDLREAERRLWLVRRESEEALTEPIFSRNEALPLPTPEVRPRAEQPPPAAPQTSPVVTPPPQTGSTGAKTEVLPSPAQPSQGYYQSAPPPQYYRPSPPVVKSAGISRHLIWVAGIIGFWILVVVLYGIYRRSVSETTTQTSGVTNTPKPARSPVNANQAPSPATARLRHYTYSQTLRGHDDFVRALAFSPDGETLATASGDKTLRFWDVATGIARNSLKGHTKSVSSVAYSPDGTMLASGSFDNTLKLWDARTGALKQTMTGHTDMVNAVAFSPDGMALASGSDDNTVILWNVSTGTLRRTLPGHTNHVYAVAFSPDGTTLASASFDNTVKLWDAETGALKQTLSGHTNAVWTVAYSPDGKTLASGGGDKTIRLWDARTGALKQTLTEHLGNVYCVAFSPDGRMLANSSEDKTVQLWDAQTGAWQQTLTGHDEWINTVAFSPDGLALASGSGDHTVRLYRADLPSNSVP